MSEEMYKIWFDYLKQSNDYKEFCQWTCNEKGEKIPKRFVNDDGRIKQHFTFNYNLFGNILEANFDECWQHIQKKIDGLHERNDNILEKNKSAFIWNLTRNWIDFKKTHDREPTLEDIDELLCHINHPGYLFFWFKPISIMNYDNVAEEFIKKLKDHNEKYEFFRRLSVISHLHTQGKLKLKELRYYLDAYDLKNQGLRYEEITKKLNKHIVKKGKNKGKEKDISTIEREMKKYIAYAKKIIKNVEMGEFPGYY